MEGSYWTDLAIELANREGMDLYYGASGSAALVKNGFITHVAYGEGSQERTMCKLVGSATPEALSISGCKFLPFMWPKKLNSEPFTAKAIDLADKHDLWLLWSNNQAVFVTKSYHYVVMGSGDNQEDCMRQLLLTATPARLTRTDGHILTPHLWGEPLNKGNLDAALTTSISAALAHAIDKYGYEIVVSVLRDYGHGLDIRQCEDESWQIITEDGDMYFAENLTTIDKDWRGRYDDVRSRKINAISALKEYVKSLQ